jgi:hypothetical protein
VFCGSSSGLRPEYDAAAAQLGRTLARRSIALVYGGARVGLMRALADAVLESGGHAIGVMPELLVHREIAHSGLTELRVVGMAGYWIAGLWTPSVNRYYLLSLPAVLLAIPLGRVVNTRLDTRRFLTVVHAGLLASGAGLLLQAIIARV